MSSKRAYRALESDEDRLLPTRDKLNEVDYLTATIKTIINTISKHVSIVIAITLSTAALALVVAVVSVGMSTALNSNSDLQSVTVTVTILEMRLNQSMNATEYLGYQMSALQTEAEKLYRSRHEELKNLQLRLDQSQITAFNPNSDIQYLTAVVNNLQRNLDQSVNTIEHLRHEISTLQANKVTLSKFGVLNQTVNSIQDAIREHSDFINIYNLKEELKSLQLRLNQSQVTVFNSNSDIQSLTAAVHKLHLKLKNKLNTIGELGRWISTIQANTATQSQYDGLNQKVKRIQDTIHEHLDFLNRLKSKGSSVSNPATSCSELPPNRPSGEYWILKNSSSVQMYCDMDGTFGNTSVDWMIVANIDMTDSNQQCPDQFVIHTRSTAPRRTCSRPEYANCVSTTFPVHGIEYSLVCGRVIGYQFGTTEAFSRYHSGASTNVIQNFVDGVILTHGQEHIWTFAAAHDEKMRSDDASCPCIQSDRTYTRTLPPFIGQDYFCDTGSRTNAKSIFYSDDPLWDGQGCGGTSTCCSFNNPPWFCKQLPQPTTDDIMMRVCLSNKMSDENILFEQVDIFVH